MSTSNDYGGIAFIIWDCAPVYSSKKYDPTMNDTQKYSFVKEWFDAKNIFNENVTKHTFTDGVEMYFSPSGRNRHFMEAVLIATDYSDEDIDCASVTSPTIFLTTDLQKAQKIVGVAIDIHNKITDMLLERFKN
jgi:hypothetical protein